MDLSGWSYEVALCPATRLSCVQYDREGTNLDLIIVSQLFVQTLPLPCTKVRFATVRGWCGYHFSLWHNMAHCVRRLVWHHSTAVTVVAECGMGTCAIYFVMYIKFSFIANVFVPVSLLKGLV